MKAQKSIVLKRNFKGLMSILLPIVKKVVSNQINKIKSRIIRKVRPNKIQNTPKKVSNREIKSLENIINTPKIVTQVVTSSTKLANRKLSKKTLITMNIKIV